MHSHKYYFTKDYLDQYYELIPMVLKKSYSRAKVKQLKFKLRSL